VWIGEYTPWSSDFWGPRAIRFDERICHLDELAHRNYNSDPADLSPNGAWHRCARWGSHVLMKKVPKETTDDALIQEFLNNGGKVSIGKTKPLPRELGLSNNSWNNKLTKEEKATREKKWSFQRILIFPTWCPPFSAQTGHWAFAPSPRCSPSDRTLAAGAKSSRRRIGSMRTKLILLPSDQLVPTAALPALPPLDWPSVKVRSNLPGSFAPRSVGPLWGW
jgi:hypothetical protein